MDKEGKSKENKKEKEDKENKEDKEDKGRYHFPYESVIPKRIKSQRRKMTLWRRGSEALEQEGQEVLKPQLRPTAKKDFVNTTKTEIQDRS